MAEVEIRRAVIADVTAIQALIKDHAAEDLLLPRTLSYLYENVRDFFVACVDGQVIGCGSLHVMWDDLAEVKSLAIAPGHKGKGYGRRLVEACLEEARQLGVEKVFVLTLVPPFFERLGFKPVDKEELPRKIWGECVNCPHFPDCDEVALALDIGSR
ncbi:MAG: N-acetyltransferase [Armatimonadota bacterium]